VCGWFDKFEVGCGCRALGFVSWLRLVCFFDVVAWLACGRGFGLFGFLLFGQFVVEFEGAEFIDQLDADAAAGDGFALGIGAGGLGDGDVLHGGGWHDPAGEGEPEDAFFVDAIQRTDADDLGEEATLFRAGEGF